MNITYVVLKSEINKDGSLNFSIMVPNHPLYDKYVINYQGVKFSLIEDEKESEEIGVWFDCTLQYLGEETIEIVQEKLFDFAKTLLNQIVWDIVYSQQKMENEFK